MIKLDRTGRPFRNEEGQGTGRQPCSECTHQEGLYGREMQLKRRAWLPVGSHALLSWQDLEVGRKKVMLRGQRQRVGCGKKLKHKGRYLQTAQDNKRGFSQAHEAGPTTFLMKSCEAVRSMQDHTNPILIFL